MKAPLSWLKDYVDIDVDVNTLCNRLVSAGFEVEEIIDLSQAFKNVVVCEITQIDNHPDADKLRVCKVNTGDKTLQIVTNATNVKVGDKVPVALDGAVLANGQEIKAGKLRGVESDGMFCGGEEVSADDDVYFGASGDSVLILDASENVGADMIDVLGYRDYILDVGVTPNRPDCNSIWGIARETAAALGKECRRPETTYTETPNTDIADYVSVCVEATDLCTNYDMKAVCDVQIAPSPLWLTRRLKKVGLRGINNLVDITNYVLIEIGQPMHAFDQHDISDKTIIVRRAHDGEKIIPLDGKEYTLNPDVLVIADKTRAVGLAGIMGGAESGIKDTTKAVVFESAKFAKENIRRNSKSLGLRSDSSARFEKGVDAFSVDLALSRAMNLIEQLNCAKVVKGRITIGERASRRSIEMGYDRIEWLLGVSIPKDKVVSILKTLDISVVFDGDKMTCSVPEYRDDLVMDCDIIEEIIRLYGYDEIKSTLLKKAVVTKGGRSQNQIRISALKDVLVGQGFNEISTYTFTGGGVYDKLNLSADSMLLRQVRLLNPLGEETSILRTTMAGSMLNIIQSNLNKKNEDLRLFEIAKCFFPKELPIKQQPIEENRIAMGISYEGADFFNLMSVVELLFNRLNINFDVKRSRISYLHPGISADIYCGDVYLGYVGKLHPVVKENFDISKDVFIAELNYDEMNALAVEYKQYVPFGRYPTSVRDLALVVDSDVMAGDMIKAMQAVSPLIHSVRLFDVYKNAAFGIQKSLAFSITFGSSERTLKDTEIDECIGKLIAMLGKDFNARLRV